MKHLLLIPIMLLVFSSCTDETLCEIEEETKEEVIDNTIAFHDEEFTAERQELFAGIKARATGTIISLEKLSSIEYKLKANITLEDKTYYLVATFNPYEERAPIDINGDVTEGYLSVYSCTDCSANLRVNLNRTFTLNSLNYVRFNVTFSSDL
jgi:hypothetical protein